MLQPHIHTGRFRACLRAVLFLASAVATAAHGQASRPDLATGADIQRRQDQEAGAQRERAAQRPDVFNSPPVAPSSSRLQFPQEQPCFAIRSVTWQDSAPPQWLHDLAQQALGHCVGGQGLQMLQKALQAKLIDRGQVTSRVLVPEQSLATGKLALRYIPGTIGKIKSDGMPGWWRMALPSGSGSTLDQRDLDQALENIRRLPGQADAKIDLVPGAALGESDLVLHPGTGKRWHAYLGGDNAGLDSTGKNQVNASLVLDSPLFLYDQLSVAWNSNAHIHDRDAGARSSSISYSIPFGYWTLFANASKSTYRQTVAGFDEPIVYQGTSKQIDGGVSVVPYRGTDYKGSFSAKMFRKWSNNTIDDLDIDVQHRDVVGYEINVGHRHYVGNTTLDGSFGVRSTLPGMSNAPGVVIGDPDWDGRSTVLLASLGASVPFELAGQKMAYQTGWQWQHAKTPLVPTDYFTIGNRYAVRGFDGQMTLSAESGWSLRNELALALGNSGQQLYTGVDAGRVSGPAAQYLAGQTLVGLVAGLRGRLSVPYVAASYDLSAGWPLKKPDQLKTDSPTIAFSLTLEF
ncbi:ShlB/FhaC/HecB family hemolysin secretion/activation protein [Achromobacter aloeverae]|uniref:ShlB/FhaC/HecB family hemolysin secretion/activation protein n=1 Tax=Achromobacter aloeverae TaxID=1750518 RepID=A0A4Q1HP88_9BURK|nr:ShlB/FhaC/HecB family hemolysin secretion/activation protein [Achromobacter aloeverae]